MIELRHLSAGYRGTPVLEDVTLTFPTGCVTVLLGPNGCGKTTLLKTALGLLPPLSGEVLTGESPCPPSPRPRRPGRRPIWPKALPERGF